MLPQTSYAIGSICVTYTCVSTVTAFTSHRRSAFVHLHSPLLTLHTISAKMSSYPEYRSRVARMTPAALVAEKRTLTRKYGGHSAKVGLHTASSVLLGPFALIGIAYSSARGADTLAKLKIVDDMLNELECNEPLRKRDLWAGVGITAATAGLGHGASHIAHHVVSEIDYNHNYPELDDWACKGIEKGTDKGAKYLLEHAYDAVANEYNDPSRPVRKMCDGCYIVSGFTYSRLCNKADFSLCRA